MNFIVFGIFGVFSALFIKTKLYPFYVVLTLFSWNTYMSYINDNDITFQVIYEITILTLTLSLSVLIPYFIVFFGKFFLKSTKKRS